MPATVGPVEVPGNPIGAPADRSLRLPGRPVDVHPVEVELRPDVVLLKFAHFATKII